METGHSGGTDCSGSGQTQAGNGPGTGTRVTRTGTTGAGTTGAGIFIVVGIQDGIRSMKVAK